MRRQAMIRLLFTALFLILFLLFSIPHLIIDYYVGKKHPEHADLFQLRTIQGAFKIVLLLSGTRLTVIGEENIPKDTAVLYVGNHRSFFDTVITYSRCPGLTGYVAKHSLEKVPLLSTWMKRLHCLFLNRDNLKEGLKTILLGIDQVKRGISICIFPEGTRNRNENEADLLPFKEGSLKITEKTGCPIIPMALTGSADIFENHFPWIRSAHVTLQYGEPIYPKDLSKEDQKRLGSYTQRKIIEMLNNANGIHSKSKPN